MSRIQDQVTELMTLELRRRAQWDEAPALYLLYLHAGTPWLRDLQVPEAAWEQAPTPLLVLDAMSRGLEKARPLLQGDPPLGLHGAAFRCETWQVPKPRDPGEARRLEADVRARRVHLRPDRTETRTMCAVDRAGITYTAEWARGAAAPRTAVWYPGPGHPAVTGIVPEALTRMVTGLLGVPLPDR